MQQKEIQDHACQQGEFQGSLGYIRHCFKKQTLTKKKGYSGFSREESHVGETWLPDVPSCVTLNIGIQMPKLVSGSQN